MLPSRHLPPSCTREHGPVAIAVITSLHVVAKRHECVMCDWGCDPRPLPEEEISSKVRGFTVHATYAHANARNALEKVRVVFTGDWY